MQLDPKTQAKILRPAPLHEAQPEVELGAASVAVLDDVEPLHIGRGAPEQDAVDEAREVQRVGVAIARPDVIEDEVGGGGPSGQPARGEDTGLDDVVEGEK